MRCAYWAKSPVQVFPLKKIPTHPSRVVSGGCSISPDNVISMRCRGVSWYAGSRNHPARGPREKQIA